MSNPSTVVKKAQSYIGQGYQHFTSTFGVGLMSWCGFFVATVFKECHYEDILTPDGGAGTIARLSVPAGKGKRITSNPRAGDVICFLWPYHQPTDEYFASHVGIVEKVDNDNVYTIEGNANSNDEGAATVCRKTWAKNHSYIRYYYRPNYTDSNGPDDLGDSDSGTSVIEYSEADPMYIEDSFANDMYTETYSSQTINGEVLSADTVYMTKLKDGLRINNLDGIMGIPHQFLPIADARLDSNTNTYGTDNGLGRVYSEKIIKQIPLLFMTPGVPAFMGDFNDEQKVGLLAKFATDMKEGIEELIAGRSGKYYSLKYDYTNYFHYVNAMLRSAAYYLEIQDETINGKKLGTLNWFYQTGTNNSSTENGNDIVSKIFNHAGLGTVLGHNKGTIPFYVDAGNAIDESFSNSTTESQLASSLNSLSDKGREMNFIVGNVGSEVGLKLNALTGGDDVEDKVLSAAEITDRLLGKGNVLSNIIGKATNILAGGRIIFPEIWSDSSFSRSYSCSMKLVSPSGDKLSIFLNILVPIYHLLAFTLPRQSIEQGYFSPFLVRAYYKGLFNIDMGIITNLSINKGDEGEWNTNGLPTIANVSFEIKDLYDGMFMSKLESETGYQDLLSNTQELDYIANSCGINVNDQETFRRIKMAGQLGFLTKFVDKITINVFGGIAQSINQSINDVFGVF